MNRMLLHLQNAIFPNRCLFCNSVIAIDAMLCAECEADIPYTPQSLECEHKIKHELFLQVSPFYYENGADQAVKALKFNTCLDKAGKLAVFMAQKLTQERLADEIDIIVPVPMHRVDLNRRGYNQSILLAKNVGKHIEKPVHTKLLLKKKRTQKQHDLNAKERESNLNNAFLIKNPQLLVGRTVLLIDDVYTTGSTAIACTSVMKSAGVKRVIVLTATKTKSHI